MARDDVNTREPEFIVREAAPGDGAKITELWLSVLPKSDDWMAWVPDQIDNLIANHQILCGLIMTQGETERCAAFGMSAFLHDHLVEEFVRAPRAYFNVRLLNRHKNGHDTFLTQEQQAEKNAADGLEMFVLEYVQETFDFEDEWAHQLLNAIVPVYHAVHAGFNIKRSMHETEDAVGHIQIAGGKPSPVFRVTPRPTQPV